MARAGIDPLAIIRERDPVIVSAAMVIMEHGERIERDRLEALADRIAWRLAGSPEDDD
jgi:hypothetical protein